MTLPLRGFSVTVNYNKNYNHRIIKITMISITKIKKITMIKINLKNDQNQKTQSSLESSIHRARIFPQFFFSATSAMEVFHPVDAVWFSPSMD